MTESQQPSPNQDNAQERDPSVPPTPPQPPLPYAQPQSPYAPPQPYGSPSAQQPPYPGSPQQPYGYGAAGPYQNVGGPQPPYPAQPPYPPASEPPRKKVWPWILGACLLVFLLGIGGCVSCMSFAILTDRDRTDYYDRHYSNPYDYSDPYDYDRKSDPGYNDGFGDGSGSNKSDTLGGLTLEDIKSAVGDVPNTIEGGRCSAGVYEIGKGKDIDPGLYFLEGSADIEADYYVFDYDDDTRSYKLDDAVVYFGNYFASLEPGDVVVYLPNNDTARMYPSGQAEFNPQAPYGSGLYRVGIDIPSGTYTITADSKAAAKAQNDSAAIVMKDLEFDDDSFITTKYVATGGSQTITVKDGDFLEIYAAIATPEKSSVK